MRIDKFSSSFFGSTDFVELLQYRALHQPNDTAYIYLTDGEDQEETITYVELDTQARAIGAWLESKGLVGERALLLYPAGIDFIAAFFGCLYAGVVAVPAYPPRRNRKMTRIESIVKDADAQVALVTTSVLDQVEHVIDETPILKQLKWLATDQLEDHWPDRWKKPEVHGGTLAFLQYTSGSTGTPKGVMLTHSNLMHNSALICHAYEHTRSTRGVFWMPSYHDMGLIGGILQPMFVGITNILMSPMSFLQKPFRWLRAISKYRGTTSGGPNFAYDMCVQRITEEQKAQLDLSSWTVAFSGAEPVRKETLDRFAEAFEPCGFNREAYYPCYGLAEGTLIVTGGFRKAEPIVRSFDVKAMENKLVVPGVYDDLPQRELVGSGTSLLEQQIVIVHPEKKTRMPDDRIGEIWVAGQSVAKGYWRRPEETQDTFNAYISGSDEGPFLRTGDLGFFYQNELYIAGRTKDLIIIRGLNHYPQDIEHTVEQCHSRIRTGAVGAFTIEAEETEKLVLVAEVGRRAEPFIEEIYDAIRRSVTTQHQIQVDAILLIKKNIPKTSSGKIQRHACRNGMKDGSLEIVAQWINWDETSEQSASEVVVENTSTEKEKQLVKTNGQETPVIIPADMIELVMQKVKLVAKERAVGITGETNIVELGLDSLERIEIISSLEESLGGRLPEQVLLEIETCQEVAEACQKYLGTGQQQQSIIPDDQDIPEEYYQFKKYPEYDQLKQSMHQLESKGLANPYFSEHEGITADTTVVDGREMISFASYNYLGMSGDPYVTQAAKDAIDKYGSSVSASRLVSGEKRLHRKLEQGIAGFIGVQDAILYVGGHSTNETTIGHLFGPGDLVIHDALAHNSILQGCILSGARRRSFPHNDYQALDEILQESRRQYRRVLIAIEGVYSMDGDYPDLPKFIEVKKRHQTFLMVDEAHSIGVLGLHGRGISEHYDLDPNDVDLWMGTLSKSFGSCGGYIAGCKEVVEYLKYTAPGFVYSVGVSPANTAAALASLQLMEEEPERVAQLIDRSLLFLELAKKEGLNTGFAMGTPVVPIITGNSAHALQLSIALKHRGINVQPIMYPAVEESAARLRFFITCRHSEQQIRETVTATAEELAKIDPKYIQHDRSSAKQSSTIQPSDA